MKLQRNALYNFSLFAKIIDTTCINYRSNRDRGKINRYERSNKAEAISGGKNITAVRIYLVLFPRIAAVLAPKERRQLEKRPTRARFIPSRSPNEIRREIGSARRYRKCNREGGKSICNTEISFAAKKNRFDPYRILETRKLLAAKTKNDRIATLKCQYYTFSRGFLLSCPVLPSNSRKWERFLLFFFFF